MHDHCTLMRGTGSRAQVYVSNASHALSAVEYVQKTRAMGILLRVPPPEGGWVAHTWHQLQIPIRAENYATPARTRWDKMDRFELFYSHPHPRQRLGDYVRVKHVYVRSARDRDATLGTHHSSSQARASREPCLG